MLKKSMALVGLTFSLAANAAVIDFDNTSDQLLGEEGYIIDDGFMFVTNWDGGSTSYEAGNVGEGNALRLDTTESCWSGPVETCEPWDLSNVGYWSLDRDGAARGPNFTVTSFDVLEVSGTINLRSWEDGVGWRTLNVNITEAGHYEFGVGTDFEGIDEFLIAMYNGDTALIDNIVISEVSTVPVPAAAWLFGSALIGLAGIKRKK